MTEQLRLLLYPLGFLANLLFGVRFIVQWLQSEKRRESFVPKSFWVVSCAGNLILALHGFIQLQFPILLFQTLGALISLRNLDLLGRNRFSLRQTLVVAGAILVFVTLAFFSQTGRWMRAPTKETLLLPWVLHFIGGVGIFLFASRFWVQWWQAESRGKSGLSRSFWWMSLLGGLLSLFYFFHLRDPVNLLGYGLGLIPYVRNLHLLKRRRFHFETANNSFFLLAAEKSGDQLGGELLKKLKMRLPETHFFGVGGEQMKREGLEVKICSEEFEVMGLTALFPAAFRLWKNFQKIKKMIEQERPKVVLLIDYAEYNMLLAKSLRKGGYKGKIVQYVIPSVWAWRKGRIDRLSKDYDLLLSILPFEADYFAGRDVKVAFVGHPLARVTEAFAPTADWKEKKGLSGQILALFPGSRSHEIEENLPYQLEVAKRFSFSVIISVASSKLKDRIERLAKRSGVPYLLVESTERYELMKAADLTLSTCGTVILELALLGTPTVVLYKLSYLNYLIAYYLFRIRLTYFSLPNIMMKRALFPEHVDKKISYERLAGMVKDVMRRNQEIRQECRQMRELLCEEKSVSAVEELYALFMS